jgi:hypothetical protein
MEWRGNPVIIARNRHNSVRRLETKMVTRTTKTTKAAPTTAATPATPQKMSTTSPKADVAPVVATPVGVAPVAATPVEGAPKAVVVETVMAVVADAPIKKPELIERVMAETGLKKKDVKPVVEAMLAVLGRALIAGEELTVPPLGKVMINRTKEVANATIVNLKLRHPTANKIKTESPTQDPLTATLE